MLKTKWIEKRLKYDGTQLRSLFAYLDHGVLGESGIAFRGPCAVDFSHMVDGEDLRERAQICGDDMVHFIFELFDRPLMTGVFLQRLFATIVADVIKQMTENPPQLKRLGDDLYVGKKKLSISIATRSVSSVLVHFAVNVTTKGTPVPTVGLADFKMDPKHFAQECLKAIQTEYESIVMATQKVRSVP